MSKTTLKTVPVFFGFDERFAMFGAVAILSMIQSTNPNRNYNIHILHNDITEETMGKIQAMATKNCHIEFNDVTKDIEHIVAELPIRDYYSPSTYFRLVIAKKFPQYDKAIYIDADTIIRKDVGRLYDIHLDNNLVAATNESVMAQMDPAGRYAEQVVGVNRFKYFNAGMLLINSKLWREEDVLGQFVELVHFYDFTVAQDQDYLNVICQGRVRHLPKHWNMEAVTPWKGGIKRISIMHYAFVSKPWKDITAPFADAFWSVAAKSPFFSEIKEVFAKTTEADLQWDKDVVTSVLAKCEKEIERVDNFLKKRKALREQNKIEYNNPVLA